MRERMSRKQRIMTLSEQSGDPLSINTIADELGLHWKTVDETLHELYDHGNVDKRKLGHRLTLWWDREIPL